MNALPIEDATTETAEIAIGALRPSSPSDSGSDNQHPTRLAEKYGAALTIANIQAPSFVGSQPLSLPKPNGRPSNSNAQLRLAPLLLQMISACRRLKSAGRASGKDSPRSLTPALDHGGNLLKVIILMEGQELRVLYGVERKMRRTYA